jgi:hypothetical protein
MIAAAAPPSMTTRVKLSLAAGKRSDPADAG